MSGQSNSRVRKDKFKRKLRKDRKYSSEEDAYSQEINQEESEAAMIDDF